MPTFRFRFAPVFAAFAAFVSFAPAPRAALVAAAPMSDVTVDALAPIKADSRITAAMVYPDRAVVSRVASVAARAGTNEIVFEALPGELQDDSVQVSARGVAAASLLDVTVRTTYVAAEPDARLRAAAERIVMLRRRDLELGDEAKLLATQRELMATMEQTYLSPAAASANAAASSPAPARLSLDDYEKFLDFSKARRRRLEQDARGLAAQQAELADEIAAAEKEFARLRGEQPARRLEKAVALRLSADAAGAQEVTLRYAVPAADWTPAYDARLSGAERTVRLDAFGLVRNRTGEDWRDIELTLSTARPGLGGAAPELEPWRLSASGWAEPATSFFGFSRKPKRPDPSATVIGQQGVLNPDAATGFADGAAAGVTVAGLLAESAKAEPAFALRDATFAAAKTAAGATSASFRIATPVSLASDNTPRRVPIGSASFAAELSYEAAPKLQEAAYLAATVKNSGEMPFLAGRLNAFLDDTFVASSRLETTMPGEAFALNLGADEAVSIKRKVLSRFTEERGLASRTRRISYEVLTTVTNNKRTAERVVVRDLVPVARDEKVVVKLTAPAERELLKPEDATAQPPRPGIVREAEGRIAWRLDLKPGEKRELPLKFTVEHPVEVQVDGLE